MKLFRVLSMVTALLATAGAAHAQVPSSWHLELANSRDGRTQKAHQPARTSESMALIGGLPIVIDEQTANLALSTVLGSEKRIERRG